MKRNPNRSARSKGSKAEGLLLRLLEDQGYEVRRTHLSAFPDIIAWNRDGFLLIEVKARANRRGVSNAVSLFRASVKTLTSIPMNPVSASYRSTRIKARLLCFVLFDGDWLVYEYVDGETASTESIIIPGGAAKD